MGGESSNSSSSSSTRQTTSTAAVITPVIASIKPSKPWTERDISKEEENALDYQFNKLKNSKMVPIYSCKYVNSKKNNWEVIFLGTEGTPYESGYFKVQLLFKEVFPKHGPEAKFITKMFHPNIASDGHVCMKLLNSWNEKTTMENIFYGIIDLLDNPIPDGGYENEARKELEKDYDKYMNTVEEYTEKYAQQKF